MTNAEQNRATRWPTSRRSALRYLAGAAVGSIGFHGAVRAQGKILRIGATFDNSSVEKTNGSGLFQGSTAYFKGVNRAGGINGMKVELVMADDQFKPEVAKANGLAFQADSSVLALLHPLGTRQTAALMDSVQDMAIVGPNTGTISLRKKPAANVFWVRANYDQEVDKLVSTAAILGISKIGLVHPNDPLGQSVLAAFNTSCSKYNLKPSIIATTPNTTSMEVEPAAQMIAKAAPQVVIMSLAGTAPAFIRALRKAGSVSSTYGLSITASAASIRELGELSRGLGFSIIVPSPFATKNEIVRRYQTDMEASGSKDFSLPSLEGYIDARVLAEGLRRAGSAPTRAAVISALEQIEALDLGGVRISYGRGLREGNRFVDVAVVGSNGRFIS
jgi:branched-chain amino acid transport system substrate-binding protein